MESLDRGKHSVSTKKSFVARYRQGLSAKTLGKEAGVSENTILRWNRAFEAVERRALTQQRRRGYQSTQGKGDHDLAALGTLSTHTISGKLTDLDRRIGTLERWLKTGPDAQ